MIGDRLKRAEGTWMKKLLEGLGVDSLDSLKARLTPTAPAPDAGAELQQLNERLQAAETKAGEAEQRLTALQQERRTEKRNGILSKALAEARATDPESLLILLHAKHGEQVGKVFGADDSADPDQLKQLVETARAGFKGFFGSAWPGVPSNAGGRTPNPEGQARTAAARTNQKIIRG
jgi:hypothetical protein